MRLLFVRLQMMAVCLVLVTGCANQSARHVLLGDYDEMVRKSESFNFDTLSYNDTALLCYSLLKSRAFARLDPCLDRLESLMALHDGEMEFSVFGKNIYNRALSEYILLSWRQEAALELGNYREAVSLADRMVAIEQSSHLTIVGPWAGSLPAEYHGVMALEGLGLSAMSYLYSGQTGKANQLLQKLEQTETDFLEGRWAEPRRQMWRARLLFAQQRYEEALVVLEDDGPRSLSEFINSLNMAMNVINPLTYLVTPVLFGATSLGELTFSQELEPELMMCRAQYETGRITDSHQCYKRILDNPRTANFGSVYFLGLHGRGLTSLALGDDESALADFVAAAEVLEKQRASVTSEKGRMGFLAGKASVYHDLVKLLVRTGQAEAAFEYAERGKARALVDLLATRQQFPGRQARMPETGALLEAVAREQYTELARIQNGKLNVRSVNVHSLQQLQEKDPELASLISVQGVELPSLQAQLGAQEALVEYFGHDAAWFAFVVTRHQVRAVALDPKELTAGVQTFRKALEEARGTSYVRHGQALYRRLIAPLGLPAGIRALTIVPHGPLHYLPFAALQNERSGFLLDNFSLRILPSASVLNYLRADQVSSASVLILGNPDLGNPNLDLPGAEREAVSVAQRFAVADLKLRKQASESYLRNHGEGQRLIHFAGHGTFDPVQPMASALLLSPDDEHDGMLQVSELYELRLDADLVTLSGCQTALGNVTDGDDVVGFTRGFMFAGARTIVSSLWEVDDEATRRLMTIFYQSLSAGGAITALQSAQKMVKATYQQHPYYWAAFQLYGSGT
ncbi:MAG: CHAT domain-containing protein [Pseudomonadales bacterium]|nr:CHAT domain-containing protein [Pseudomonadales bacterium]